MRFLIPVFACLLPLCGNADIQIVGSDLLKSVVETSLADYKPQSGGAVVINMQGSLPGSQAFEEGKADILIEALLPDKPVPHNVLPFTYSATFVLVHKSNPISEITLPQLAGIFGQGEGGAPTQRWSELGAATFNRTANPAILDERGSLLVAYFRNAVLANRPLKPTVKRLANQAEVVLTVSGDPGAIAISDRIPGGDSSVRALPLSKGNRGDFAFGPTAQNIHYGEYPLRLGYYIRYDHKKKQELKDILTILLGDATAQILTREGLVAIPESQRKRLLLELDK